MHCNQEQIEALLDGELTGPEGDAVLAHLRDCPGCRSYYRQLLAMEQALRADTDPVPEDLLADIMSRVHDTPQRRRRAAVAAGYHGHGGVSCGGTVCLSGASAGGKGRRLPLQRYPDGFLRQQALSIPAKRPLPTRSFPLTVIWPSPPAAQRSRDPPARRTMCSRATRSWPSRPPVAVPAGTGAGRGRHLSPHCPTDTGTERRRAGTGASHG